MHIMDRVNITTSMSAGQESYDQLLKEDGEKKHILADKLNVCRIWLNTCSQILMEQQEFFERPHTLLRRTVKSKSGETFTSVVEDDGGAGLPDDEDHTYTYAQPTPFVAHPVLVRWLMVPYGQLLLQTQDAFTEVEKRVEQWKTLFRKRFFVEKADAAALTDTEGRMYKRCYRDCLLFANDVQKRVIPELTKRNVTQMLQTVAGIARKKAGEVETMLVYFYQVNQSFSDGSVESFERLANMAHSTLMKASSVHSYSGTFTELLGRVGPHIRLATSLVQKMVHVIHEKERLLQPTPESDPRDLDRARRRYEQREGKPYPRVDEFLLL